MIRVEGEPLRVLVLKNPFEMAKGMRPYQDSEGKYDGLLFIFPREKEVTFTGKGMKKSVYLCSLLKRGEGFVKKDCTCLRPGEEIKIKGKVFLERLASEDCRNFYTIGGDR